MATNEAQRQVWNSEEFAAAWPKRERFTTTMTPVLMGALKPQPGERILDIGSGGGLASIAAARAVAPGGQVQGFDLSAPLSAMATRRAAEAQLANVHFSVGDAQVDSIPGGPYDAAMSQFGVMFFADPVAAFLNIRTRLRRGGRLAFVCWQPMEANSWFYGRVLAPFQEQTAQRPMSLGDGPAPGPFAFGDESYVRGILEGAGFVSVGRQALTVSATIPSDSLIDESTVRTMGIPPERQAEAWTALQAFAARMQGADGDLNVEFGVQIFSATNPG